MDWTIAAIAFIAVAGLSAAWTVRRERGGSARARRSPDGTQEARVVVEHGYRPSHIELEAGVPAVLHFERREDDPCTEMLVSELWPSAHRLAAHQDTPIRFTPQHAGRYAFTCGMGMYSGELIVHGRKV